MITVDLLGHGESEAPDEVRPYEPENAVARIVALMDHLGIEDALICGHSLGGALALRIALDQPRRVAGLVIINSNSAAGTAQWRQDVQPSLTEMATRLRAEGTAFMKETRLYPGRSARLPDAARKQLAADFERLTAAGIAGTAEGLVAKVNAAERLGRLRVPTLVVIGDRDGDFVRNAPALIGAMPADKVRAITLTDAGHAANLEKPAEFNAALVAFAREIEYLEPPPAGEGSRRGLFVFLGAALVVVGAALLAASFILGGDKQPALAGPAAGTPTPLSAGRTSAAISPAASPSPRETVAGTTPSPAPAGTSPTGAPTTAATPTTAPATVAPQSTPTPVPPTPVPPTPTAIPATPTPTEAPTATATPTAASAPGIAISGPSRVAVGQAQAFTAVVTGPEEKLRGVGWSPGGPGRSVELTFSSPGCITLQATAFFEEPLGPVSAFATVAVGEVTC